MQAFTTARETKEFLVSRIVAEAQRENVPLSELERKMLYFSETDWTLPDMAEVNEAFDREYDQEAYEEKIGKLIRNLLASARDNSQEELTSWDEAVQILDREDHYLLVMVSAAKGSGRTSVRPRGDILKLWATGFAIVCIMMFLIIFLSSR